MYGILVSTHILQFRHTALYPAVHFFGGMACMFVRQIDTKYPRLCAHHVNSPHPRFPPGEVGRQTRRGYLFPTHQPLSTKGSDRAPPYPTAVYPRAIWRSYFSMHVVYTVFSENSNYDTGGVISHL